MCLEALNKEFPISTTHFVRVVIHEVVKSFTQTPTGESFLPFTFIHGSIAFLKYVVGTCFCHHPSLKKSQKQQAAVHHNHLPKISGVFFLAHLTSASRSSHNLTRHRIATGRHRHAAAVTGSGGTEGKGFRWQVITRVTGEVLTPLKDKGWKSMGHGWPPLRVSFPIKAEKLVKTLFEVGKLLLCCKYLAYKSWAENNKHSVSRMMIQRFGGNVLDRHPNPPKSSWGNWVWSDQLISLKQLGNSSWAGKLGTGKEVHILKNRVGR